MIGSIALFAETSADGANWTNSTNWQSSAPLGQWDGVDTDDTGRVTELILFHNQLSGAIPGELGGLSNLQRLWLSGNQLDGPIPAELGDLSKLQSLYLGDGNRLTGCIPSELRDVANNDLLTLNLRFCDD